MLKIGLIGFGFMGRMHFENYVRLMREGAQVQLTAICDMDIERLKDQAVKGNIATEQAQYDLSQFRLYDNIEEMLANEQLDAVDITLPTHLHADVACRVLEQGLHVLCEKPMALTYEEGVRMAETAARANRKFMVAQCLRFWPAYEYLKACVEDGRYGAVKAAYFFRGGAFPGGWYTDKSKSRGNLLDMHIHDVDMVNWLFGRPAKVSAVGRSVLPGEGYDIVSTHYGYADGKVVNAQSDWTLEGDFGFEMTFRVNFERGNLVLDKDGLRDNPEGAQGFKPELSPDMGYYREIKYFVEALLNDAPIETAPPESTLVTMEIVEAEIQSADRDGDWIKLG